MRGHVNNLLIWGIFSSVTFQSTALDCETIKSKHGDACPLCLQLLLPVLLLLAMALILGFWIRRRRKAGKTMRKNELKFHENTLEEVESYASIETCKTQAEPGPSLELFYATPVFHNQASEQQEAHDYCEADYTYLNVKTQRAGM
ncbi:allergin-1 isoform X3 [Ochotona princeps]|uniref:allergin-1 isoform X3 n=1 Tax=Ochotona princeps TaxID=9978 RepID=UPI00271553BC|nr:allergin-1 isoform X3 [Ochotona princeps]